MRLLVVSGLSGSGKSSALQLLEDDGFTCIDNIPVSLLPSLIDYISQQQTQRFAIGIDARNIEGDLSAVARILENSRLSRSDYRAIYLETQTNELLKRFSETRRKHPLSDNTIGLNEALEKERELLSPMVDLADIILDTTALNLHQLRSTLRKMVIGSQSSGMALTFTSFGFKYGVPRDADFVFDVRSLPNPHWQSNLRLKTGLDSEVMEFLRQQTAVRDMVDDIERFVSKWIPSFEDNNRSYLTVAIGCTGGMHRSVYISEQLTDSLKQRHDNVQVRHRQLSTDRS